MANTSHDIRLLYIEQMITKFKEQVQRRLFGSAKLVGGAQRLLEEMAGKVAALRYSYLDGVLLAEFEETAALISLGKDATGILRQNPALTPGQTAFLDFVDAVLDRLPDALRENASLDSLSPVQIGEVLRADKAPKTKGLLLCRVSAFDKNLQIVTNLLDTRVGSKMKVARVPPAEIMGHLSEAQFVGTAPVNALLGTRPQLNDHERQELRKSMSVLMD